MVSLIILGEIVLFWCFETYDELLSLRDRSLKRLQKSFRSLYDRVRGAVREMPAEQVADVAHHLDSPDTHLRGSMTVTAAVTAHTVAERIDNLLRSTWLPFKEGFLGKVEVIVTDNSGAKTHQEIDCKPGMDNPEFGKIEDVHDPRGPSSASCCC